MGSGLTGQEIRNRLAAFCARWSVYDGSERAEAQTFLNELFACYGTARQDVARFEEAQAGRFLDLIWTGTCIIEMKAPKEARRLAEHREQALDYWRSSSDATRGVKAARWVVVCAIRRLEIWEPGAYPTQPRLELDFVDLPRGATTPDRIGAPGVPFALRHRQRRDAARSSGSVLRWLSGTTSAKERA